METPQIKPIEGLTDDANLLKMDNQKLSVACTVMRKAMMIARFIFASSLRSLMIFSRFPIASHRIMMTGAKVRLKALP
jgi:hypothetical protein